MGELFSGMSFERDGSKYYVPAVDGTEIFNDGKAEGKIEGKAEATAECAAKHFTAEFTGDGGTSVTLEGCHFDPDFVTVRCFRGIDKYVQIGDERLLQFWMYDKKSVDNVSGIAMVTPMDGTYRLPSNAQIVKSDANAARASWDSANNTLTISDLASGTVKTIFGNGYVYRVVAVKTAD